MEAAAHAYDGVAAVTSTLGVQTRELHRALVGFSTRIGKERLPHLLARRRSAERSGRGLIVGSNRVGKHARTVRIIVSELGQQRRDLATLLDEVVGDMHELFGLRLERREHCSVAVAKAAHTDTGKKIKILTAVIADELHTVTFDKLYRRAAKGMHNVVGFERLLSSK